MQVEDVVESCSPAFKFGFWSGEEDENLKEYLSKIQERRIHAGERDPVRRR